MNKKHNTKSQDILFDDNFSMVELWADGFVAAYASDVEVEFRVALKDRFIISVIDRIKVIDDLRKAMGLKAMSEEEIYDYYINNMPEFDSEKNSINFKQYDNFTAELQSEIEQYKTTKPPCAKAYLIVLGAPSYFVNKWLVLQERIDHINNMRKECGFKPMTAEKTEEILLKLLKVDFT